MSFTSADVRRVLWTGAQAFLTTFLLLAAGVAAAPNMQEAKALGVAALVGALAAGLSAIKNLVLGDTSPLK